VDTRQLRAFLKIAELGAISRAADALGISQPSLGQQLLRLEDETGVKLFERTARGVTMTDAGRAFEPHARLIIDNAQRALADMSALRCSERIKVTLALPFSISKMIGVALVEAAIEQCPALSLRIVENFSSQIRAMIEAGSIDLGLLYDAEPLQGFVLKRLASEDLYLIGPPGRWPGLDNDIDMAPAELATLPLILPGPQHGLRQCLERTSKRLGFRLSIASEIDSLQHIVGLVADGRGVSVLPLSAVQGEVEAGTISVVRIGQGTFRRTLCLIRRSDALLTEPVHAIEDLTIHLLATVIAKHRWIAEVEARPEVEK
jgi:LysR family nitrogen assimilation transcriptional regulator